MKSNLSRLTPYQTDTMASKFLIVTHTMWFPELSDSASSKYRQIADQLADAVKNGHLVAGEKLPTVRELSRELGVTVGTVQRAYALSEQRRLIESHTGRGTFVRQHHIPEPRQRLLPQAAKNGIDMTTNAPVNIEVPLDFTQLVQTGDQHWLMANYIASEGDFQHRELFCEWLAQARGVACNAEQLLLCSGAQQALSIALSCLLRTGDTLMVEALTYPGVINLARILGLRLQPIAMDRHGISPKAFEQACREHNARVLMCMPTLHNPTSITLSQSRREALVDIARRYDVSLIEDDIYLRPDGFDLSTLHSLAPERTLHISALSKILAPGLRIGMLTAPPPLMPALISTAQTFNWMPAPYMVELALRLLESPACSTIVKQRKDATAARVAQLREAFQGLSLWSDPACTHAWCLLPYPWQANDYAMAAEQGGVFVTPARYFDSSDHQSPQAIRIALGTCQEAALLARGLAQLSQLAKRPPGALSYHF